jgi:hypothetical protein
LRGTKLVVFKKSSTLSFLMFRCIGQALFFLRATSSCPVLTHEKDLIHPISIIGAKLEEFNCVLFTFKSAKKNSARIGSLRTKLHGSNFNTNL